MRWQRKAWKAGGVALAFLIIFQQAAEARTRRYRRRNPVVVVLQPFLLARSAAHALADPIVYNAPRVVSAIAVAPIRVAYQTTHSSNSNVARAQEIDESESAEDAPIAEPDAYYLPRSYPPRPPRAQRAEPMDHDDADQPRQARASEDFQVSGGAHPTVSGSRAILRNGVACAPANAPASVKNAIWATNSLRRKPYIWGGGHGSFEDRGYDCSGTVSFALHHAGLLSAPLPSSDLMRFGERGRGRWITIYSRPGHTFATIAGLRLDTTDFRIGGNVGPRWHEDGRDTGGFIARHPVGL